MKHKILDYIWIKMQLNDAALLCVCVARCHRLTGISISPAATRGYCCDENAD